MRKITTFLISLFFCSQLFAGQIKEIVFLGDSLTDNGNLYDVLKIVPKSPPYYKGRFTNGPTWAENVGKYYYDKSYVDSKNYSYGGATAILHNILEDDFIAPITLTGEVYLYLSKFTNKKDTLFVIWVGANDYLYDRGPDADALTTNVVEKITWAMNTLMSQGATHFMIMNLPDLAKTPFAKENPDVIGRVHQVTVMHNRKLLNEIKKIQSEHSNIKIVYIDIYNVFNDLLENTPKYNQLYHKNITNITEACWTGEMMLKGSRASKVSAINADLQKALANTKNAGNKNLDTNAISELIVNSPSLTEAYSTSKLAEAGIEPCNNASQHIFWDHIHPTAVVHEILASIVEQSLVGTDI